MREPAGLDLETLLLDECNRRRLDGLRYRWHRVRDVWATCLRVLRRHTLCVVGRHHEIRLTWIDHDDEPLSLQPACDACRRLLGNEQPL